MLNQAVIEYGDENFTGAVELAQTAYLDNYEHLETPLGQLNPALKEATETTIMEDVQSAIETKIPLSELQQLVTTIDGKLAAAQQPFNRDVASPFSLRTALSYSIPLFTSRIE